MIGVIVLRQKWSRRQVKTRLANMPPCLIGIEACVRAHHLSRKLKPQPWADLSKVLDLAKRKNAVIKVSGACTPSREPYPFPDIWGSLARVFDAWGFERDNGGDRARLCRLAEMGPGKTRPLVWKRLPKRQNLTTVEKT
jgi:hypothetical protein